MLARLQMHAKQFVLMTCYTAVPILLIYGILRDKRAHATRFRDKSALFGRELKPGEAPSW